VFDLVRVKGGTFLMGSDSGDSAERPAHEVEVGDYFIGRFPVTQKEWQSVFGNNPSLCRGPAHPVERISWLDAVAFCNALSKANGLKPCYGNDGEDIFCDFRANGFRLPREAEWEYAALGGQKNRGFAYSGGNGPEAVGWYLGNALRKTHPVGKKRANELGLHDMSGNVNEWCWDWYAPYGSKAYEEQLPSLGGEVDTRKRVIRGGTCQDCSYRLRRTSRLCAHPEGAYELVGMRLARSA